MSSMSNRPLWHADQKRYESSHMYRFMKTVQQRYDAKINDWRSLHQWSVENLAEFWDVLSDFTSIKWIQKSSGPSILPQKGQMLGAKWFPGSRLNYAENLLCHLVSSNFISSYTQERQVHRLNFQAIYKKIYNLSNRLKQLGFKKGDIVAGILKNDVDAIIAMLATTSCGGVWVSCSVDFGYKSILSRLQQVQPSYIFFCQDYKYKEKIYDCTQSHKNIIKKISSLRCGFLVGSDKTELFSQTCPIYSYEESLSSLIRGERSLSHETLSFEPMAFDDPLYILFSSGTTGPPKAIVHTVGGSLLQHKKELMLHCDVKKGESMFFFTTCAWMMWNWMVSALSIGANVITYDGSPVYPSVMSLWSLLEKEKISHFGTSPKFISSCMKNKVSPKTESNLTNLRTLLSTGSPLLSKHYKWVYKDVKNDIHVASISGGTDIISCFMLGNPILPVYAGEIQSPGLGMSIAAYDGEGNELIDKKGELVCTRPFVSMPAGFLNDLDGQKYEKSYFHFYRNNQVWKHGDFIEINSRMGVTMLGRSDTTLNPGGIRIGTSEIYNSLSDIDEILDSLAVSRPKGEDVEFILFVKLKDKMILSQDIKDKIVQSICKDLSPRHKPAEIFPVSFIPYTKTGKKVELMVTQILRGEEVSNQLALEKVEVLNEFYSFTKQNE